MCWVELHIKIGYALQNHKIVTNKQQRLVFDVEVKAKESLKLSVNKSINSCWWRVVSLSVTMLRCFVIWSRSFRPCRRPVTSAINSIDLFPHSISIVISQKTTLRCRTNATHRRSRKTRKVGSFRNTLSHAYGRNALVVYTKSPAA